MKISDWLGIFLGIVVGLPFVHPFSQKAKFPPLDPQQREFHRLLQSESIHVLCVTGAAGTGKTFLSCQEAVSQLRHEKKKKMILTRPLVLVENEEMGFLPGSMMDKMTPWTAPIIDHLQEFIETKEVKRWMQDGKIEILSLGYMRGRTFDDAFILLDEAQNTTPQQMKMFLTRIGKNSKVVLNGDLQQSDIYNAKNGLQDFLARLNDTYKDDPEKMGEDGFGVVELSSEKTYRSSILRHVLRIYDEDGQ